MSNVDANPTPWQPRKSAVNLSSTRGVGLVPRPETRTSFFRTLTSIVAAPVVLSGLVSASAAATPNCLAAQTLAASGSLGYRQRGQRCEGLLRRLVGNSSAIDLLGYHAGTVDFDALRKQPLALFVLGEGADVQVSLRARMVTANSVYQMDSTPAKLGGQFPWPNDVALAASLSQSDASDGRQSIDLNQFGVVACSDRCAERPKTVYWPVQTSTSRGAGSEALSLVLRSDAYGTHLLVRLKSEEAGTVTELKGNNPDLDPRGITVLQLPSTLPKGMYQLTVQAREKETRDPMGALFATIYVPGPHN